MNSFNMSFEIWSLAKIFFTPITFVLFQTFMNWFYMLFECFSLAKTAASINHVDGNSTILTPSPLSCGPTWFFGFPPKPCGLLKIAIAIFTQISTFFFIQKFVVHCKLETQKAHLHIQLFLKFSQTFLNSRAKNGSPQNVYMDKPSLLHVQVCIFPFRLWLISRISF